MSTKSVGLSMACITALSWAVLAIALKLAVHSFSAGTVVWMRMLLASVILAVIFIQMRRQWLKILIRPPWLGVAAGLLIATNYFGFIKGIELTTASNAQILIQIGPLCFAATSIVLFHELPSLGQLLGMVLALVGFTLFYWDQHLITADLGRLQTGDLWLLFAALAWTGFALLQKHLLRTYAPQQLNLLIYAVSALALWPVAQPAELAHPSWIGVGLLLFLTLNTLVAYGALSEALARIPASHVSMIIAVNPIFTLLIMAFLTRMEVEWIQGEPIGWRGGLGAALVVIGVISTVASPPRLSGLADSTRLQT